MGNQVETLFEITAFVSDIFLNFLFKLIKICNTLNFYLLIILVFILHNFFKNSGIPGEPGPRGPRGRDGVYLPAPSLLNNACQKVFLQGFYLHYLKILKKRLMIKFKLIFSVLLVHQDLQAYQV